MNRFKYSLLAAAGITVLALVLTVIGPRRVMAALGFTPVREVNSPGRQPFELVEFLPDLTVVNVPSPAGKRLVITNISGLGDGPSVLLMVTNAGPVTPPGAGLAQLYFPFTPVVTGDACVNVTGDAVAFADPNTTISLEYSNPTAGTSAIVTLIGYYVDVP